jgi:hypothetical protein
MSAQAVVDHIEGRASALGGAAWQPPLQAGAWVFHGVVCEAGLGGGVCLLALAPPTTTLALIEQSAGISANLAEAQTGDPFAALLDELARQVIVGAQISCEYDIPPVPNGETFDRGLVNVSVASASSAARTLPQAKAAECADEQAWRYDDDADPKKIVLCPAACEALKAEPEASLDVEFGSGTWSPGRARSPPTAHRRACAPANARWTDRGRCRRTYGCRRGAPARSR